jgi:hypothetical protein
MLAVKADRFKEDEILQTKVINKINNGKKVTFKFESEEDKIDFLEQSCKLATEVGFVAGSAIGAIAGTAIGGPIGGFIGGAIGGAIGALIGRIGVWLANFLWKNVVNKSALVFKKAFYWFGLFPNRVIVKTEERREAEEQPLILRQLTRQVGELPQPIRQRVENLSSEQLENLGEALLDFSSMADLEAWLEELES